MCKSLFSSAASSKDLDCVSQGLGLRSVEGTEKQIAEVRRPKSSQHFQLPALRAVCVGQGRAGQGDGFPGCALLPPLIFGNPSLGDVLGCCCP